MSFRHFTNGLALFIMFVAVFALAHYSTKKSVEVTHELKQPSKNFQDQILFNLLTPVIWDHSFGLGAKQREEPLKVGVCQLTSAPATYNHRLIEITGFVSHGFEDFTISDPTCSSWGGIWLEYGGTAASGTMYCCGVTANRSRPESLMVEQMTIPLVDDPQFREFDKLIHHRPDSIVYATIVGRFFSGKEQKTARGVFWHGYGHMGCCSLFAIQQVISVEPHDRDDLDYGAAADQPDSDQLGCGYTFLTGDRPFNDFLEAQRKAELRVQEWAFSDPKRVATQTLARLLKIDENSITELRQTRQAQGRFVYQWKLRGKLVSYMVVVSRPYALSFYAKDPKKIAWVVIAAYKSSCGDDN